MESKYKKSLFDHNNNQANPSSLHQVKYKQIWQCKVLMKLWRKEISHPQQIGVKISKVLSDENYAGSNNTENTYKLDPLIFNFWIYNFFLPNLHKNTLHLCTRRHIQGSLLQCIFNSQHKEGKLIVHKSKNEQIAVSLWWNIY